MESRHREVTEKRSGPTTPLRKFTAQLRTFTSTRCYVAWYTRRCTVPPHHVQPRFEETQTMGKISIGMNMEAIRRHEKPFEWGVEKAAELGYEYIEPMVHWGRELMSEAKYYHTVSMWEDPYLMRRSAEKAGLKISALQAHGPLGRPDAHGDYLKQAIRYAARSRRTGRQYRRRRQGRMDHRSGRPCPDALHALRSRQGGRTTRHQDRLGVSLAILQNPRWTRPHLSPRPSPAIGINLDTGNAYLAGQDPYAWLHARVRSACPPARQGYIGRTFRRRARQGHRHARRLRLR